MHIWHDDFTLDDLNRRTAGSLLGHLGIVYTELGADYLSGTMPVDTRTIQPTGILHGGASVVLAETLGSTAAGLVIDNRAFFCVGQSISAHHLRAVREGVVTGRAEPVHIGRRSQVWDIRIVDGTGRLVSASRLTMAVLERSGDVAP
ncbi:MAG TPA: hotdog fold thioesterase [Gammaproteobacteria bacterium]|nr:hotdog fold thioesterase [Gammaproteobacteria bacterium]